MLIIIIYIINFTKNKQKFMRSNNRPTTISSRLYNVRRSIDGADAPPTVPYDFDKSFKKTTQVKKRNISTFI